MSQIAGLDALSGVRTGRAAALPVVLGARIVAVTTLLVCELTRRKLGDRGVAELAECLWPVDCQSCGRLLGDDPPAVVVDEMNSGAVASLHHQRCRRPWWNDSILVITGSGLYTTFVARIVLIPLTEGNGRRHLCPVMVVNPGLECAQLRPDGSGGWRVGHYPWLAGRGLARPGPELKVGVSA